MELSRPMTLNLLDTVVRELGGEVKEVEVWAIKGNTFYATLRIAAGGKTVEVDCRPSDGIALAVRASAWWPIKVPSKSVLNKRIGIG